MTKLSKSWWEWFRFRDRGVVPTKRLLILLGFWSFVLILGTQWGSSWTLILTANGVLLLFSLADLVFSPKRRELSFQRKMPEDLERGAIYSVQLRVQNHSRFAAYYQMVDGLPYEFQRPFPLTGAVKGHSETALGYDTASNERGDYEVHTLYVRYSSVLRLWEKHIAVPLPQRVKVIPDLADTKQVLKSAQKFLLHEGSKVKRLGSGAQEFAKIRSYAVGDDPRMINWRQTAKLQEVMTNQYEPEHGKYITILLDCGRMMGAELERGNRLERALEAAMTVAAAALKKGDYVAVLAFSNRVKAYVPPAKGTAHLQTILSQIYHLQVDEAESNYAAILHYLQSVHQKRSLLLLFSDIRTFVHEESGLAYLMRLRQRHLFLMIGVEDQTLLSRMKDTPDDAAKAMVKSMAQQQWLKVKREKSKWERQGLLMTETSEERLAVTAVSYYIDIMNKGLL